MKSFFIITALLLSFSTFAKPLTKQQLSTEFYKNLLNPSDLTVPPRDQCYPRPDITSCVKTICDKLSPFACDDESEIKEVAQMCRGNFGGDCIQTTCSNIPRWDCDDMDELKEISQSCMQVYGNSCVQFFTSRIPVFNHNERSEMVNINNQCKNISPEAIDCAQHVCNKLSKFSCDEFDELKDAVKTCSGR